MRRWTYIDGGEWRTTAEESIDPYMCNEYPKPDEVLMPASYTDEDVERVAKVLRATFNAEGSEAAARAALDAFLKDPA